MKISIKLTIFSTLITTTTLILCCAILLMTTAAKQINTAIENGRAELQMLTQSFHAEIALVADDDLSDTARRSLVLFIFRKYTDMSDSHSHYVLWGNDETIYNDAPFNPRAALQDVKQQYYASTHFAMEYIPSSITEYAGRKYLIAGFYSANIGGMMTYEHEIYLVRDVTSVYEDITALGWQFAIVAILAILLSSLAMILLTRRTIRPLAALQKNAAALADGNYNQRITLQGTNEIAQLGISFNKMADAIAEQIHALEKTAEQRQLLLSALTHELKTPMTAIIGYAESLLKVRLSPEQQERAVHYIFTECKRLERLAQKMMRLITLQGGEAFHLQEQTSSALFEAVSDTLTEIALREHISLTLDNHSPFRAALDTDMVASVLLNLFDNARKAGASTISITTQEHAILVTDNGCGIPENELLKIREPFYMIDKSYSQSLGGSGLGLTLCDLIMQAHNARLSIDSEVNRGTSVRLEFNG